MLYSMREEMGISQKELAGGLLSIPELSRLEKGEKTADKVLLEALFQRLGKSLDKLETAMSQEEYQIVFLRTCMLESLIKKDHRSVEALLGEYRLCTGEQKVLHRQFLQMMQAVDRYVQNHIAEECMEALTQALELTVPKWKPEKGRRYYLCVQEIRILLLICYLMMETEYFKTAENYLEVLFQYLEDHYTDGEEKAKIYPQCAWLLTEIYLKQNETGKAYKICRQGKACLVQNGVLTLMEEFLKLEIKCLKKLEKAEKQPEQVHELEAIQFLSQFAGEKPPLEKVCYFLMTSQQSEVVISNEMIREFRLAQHLSQEALSADICTQETLSRIERGKRSPNRNNLYAMMERMGSERKTYYGFIVADDYSLYEKVRLFKREASRGRNEEAHVLLQELEESLDRNILLNRQFLETAWLQEQWSTGRISEEHAIQKLEELLQYTMKEYDGEIHRIPFRQEFVILNQIARCMRRSGNVRGATDLYKQILGRYGNSRVLKQHHAVSLFLLYINYTGYLEVENRLEEAELIGREGIRLTMDCQRGDIAGKIMGNLSCVYEKKDGQENEVLAETCMRYSYYILKLYEDDFEHTKEYYQQKYETGRH